MRIGRMLVASTRHCPALPRRPQAGHPTGRADIDFVLRGRVLRGHRSGSHSGTAAELTKTCANNVRPLCLCAPIVLDGPTEETIPDWIGAAG